MNTLDSILLSVQTTKNSLLMSVFRLSLIKKKRDSETVQSLCTSKRGAVR